MNFKFLKQTFNLLILSSICAAILVSCETNNIDSTGGAILSSTQQTIKSFGGVFDVAINTNQKWTVETTKGWLYTDVTSGCGKSIIEVTVKGNETAEADQGDVRITTADGKITSVTVQREGTNSSAILYDVCGNAYDVVKIGDQYWLAENFKCNRYDTKSERSGVAPYVNAGDKTKWDTSSYSYSSGLTSALLAKLGYLYTWDAAAGYSSIEEAQRGAEEKRQGICPNGWRLPTLSDWDELEHFAAMGGNKSKTSKYLRAQDGWFSGKSASSAVNYDIEYNKFGFSALPAGYSTLEKAAFVGSSALFWTSSKAQSSKARFITIYNPDSPLTKESSNFNIGMSVRCVKK